MSFKKKDKRIDIRESHRLQIKDKTQEAQKASRRSSMIHALASSNLNQQIQSLGLKQSIDYSAKFKELTQTVQQCSKDLNINSTNIEILFKAINQSNQGWQFLQALCEKISVATQRIMVKHKIHHLIKRQMSQSQLNVTFVAPAIRILGHLCLFKKQIQYYNFDRLVLEVALKHYKHLFEPACFFLAKVSQVKYSDQNTDLYLSNVKMFVSNLESEYSNFPLYCQFLSNFLSFEGEHVVEQFVECNFLQICLNLIDRPELLVTKEQILALLKLVNKFYSIPAKSSSHKKHLEQNLDQLITWCVAISDKNIEYSPIKIQVFYFYSLLTEIPALFSILFKRNILLEIQKHISYSSQKYFSFSKKNQQEDSLFEILIFIQLYVKNLPAYQKFQFITTDLFYKLKCIIMDYKLYKELILFQLIETFKQIGIESQCNEQIEKIFCDSRIRQVDNPRIVKKLEIKSNSGDK